MTGVAIALAALAAGLAVAPILMLAVMAVPAGMARISPFASGAAAWARRTVRPLRLAGAEGLVPTDRERLRLQLAAAALGFVAGIVTLGTLAAFALGVTSAWLAGRSLVWRRARYRRRLDASSSALALALADALAGGHSVRGALLAAVPALEGPIAIELQRAARALELGAETDRVLDGFRGRSRSRRVAFIAAAIRIQRRSGGSLASLLREIAAAIDEQDRLREEANAASAQARFTSLVVLLLPLFGVLLGELASPGLIARMLHSPIGVWMVGSAVALQLIGIALIRRLSRMDT